MRAYTMDDNNYAYSLPIVSKVIKEYEGFLYVQVTTRYTQYPNNKPDVEFECNCSTFRTEHDVRNFIDNIKD